MRSRFAAAVGIGAVVGALAFAPSSVVARGRSGGRSRATSNAAKLCKKKGCSAHFTPGDYASGPELPGALVQGANKLTKVKLPKHAPRKAARVYKRLGRARKHALGAFVHAHPVSGAVSAAATSRRRAPDTVTSSQSAPIKGTGGTVTESLTQSLVAGEVGMKLDIGGSFKTDKGRGHVDRKQESSTTGCPQIGDGTYGFRYVAEESVVGHAADGGLTSHVRVIVDGTVHVGVDGEVDHEDYTVHYLYLNRSVPRRGGKRVFKKLDLSLEQVVAVHGDSWSLAPTNIGGKSQGLTRAETLDQMKDLFNDVERDVGQIEATSAERCNVFTQDISGSITQRDPGWSGQGFKIGISTKWPTTTQAGAIFQSGPGDAYSGVGSYTETASGSESYTDTCDTDHLSGTSTQTLTKAKPGRITVRGFHFGGGATFPAAPIVLTDNDVTATDGFPAESGIGTALAGTACEQTFPLITEKLYLTLVLNQGQHGATPPYKWSLQPGTTNADFAHGTFKLGDLAIGHENLKVTIARVPQQGERIALEPIDSA